MNTTINTTTEIASSGVGAGEATFLFFTVVIPAVFSRAIAFFTAPFIYTDMWWLLIHLILTWVLFEFYFNRHEDEDLGWSAALANSIVMVFISMELLRALYEYAGSPFYVFGKLLQDYVAVGLSTDKTILATLIIILGLLGLFTAVINYFHFLPKKIAFLISGHHTVNVLAYYLIVTTYRLKGGEPLPIDLISFTGLLLFCGVLWLIIFVAQNKRSRFLAKKSRTFFFK